MKIAIILVGIIGLSFGFYYLVLNNGNTTLEESGVKKENSQESSLSYTDISSDELQEMLRQKDFKLVDVHIPEQKHISDTDYLIAYNEVDQFIKTLPNKDEKIVLYCRSGSMSKTLSKELTSRGYSNVYNLELGMNEWLSEGREALPIGSIN